MKKIFYSLALAAMAFASCKPLSKTYDELGDVPAPVVPVVPAAINASITLTAADYATLPASDVASTQKFYHGTSDAFLSIPAILTKKYPTAGAKSNITVTYATSPVVPALKLADSLNANVASTLVTTPVSDYKFASFTYLGATVAANNFDDFNSTVVINYLKFKNQTPLPDNSIRVLTYLYFETGVTASTGDLRTDAFIFTAAAGWQKIYHVNAPQYATISRGTNFLPADVPNIPTYLNAFLKADPSVMLTAKVGDVLNVSYKTYVSSTVAYQQVMPLAFDGINWVNTNTTASNIFTLTNGVWIGQLDNTVSYSLAAADYTKIANNTALAASAAAITNLNANGNFVINGASTRWTDTQIANGIIDVLKSTFASASNNQKFLVTFKTYSQYPNLTFTFVYTGGVFVYQPAPDKTKYILTGDDYDNVSKLTTTGATTAAMTNLGSFGDFGLTGATLWTDAQINIGIASVLTTRYPAATANQSVVVSYAIFSGSVKTVTRTFKFDGAAWVAQP